MHTNHSTATPSNNQTLILLFQQWLQVELRILMINGAIAIDTEYASVLDLCTHKHAPIMCNITHCS